MEALALHDFHATAEDELSFKKGSVLKVSSKPVLSVYQNELSCRWLVAHVDMCFCVDDMFVLVC